MFAPVEHTKWQRLQRRAIDVTVASGLLVVLTPVMTAMAVAIKLQGGDSVLFRQRRGLGENARTITKFRTVNGDGAFVGRIGKFLRDSSLDEIAGLLDVVRDPKHNSLVGHKAWIAEEEQDARDSGDYWAQRSEFPTGWTGSAMLTSNQYDSPLTAALEHDFEQHWTAARHLRMISKCLLLPARKVLKRDRFSVEGVTHIGQYRYPIVSKQAQRAYAESTRRQDAARRINSDTSEPPPLDPIQHIGVEQIKTARKLLDPKRFHKVDARSITNAKRVADLIDGCDAGTRLPKRPGLTAALLGMRPLQLMMLLRSAEQSVPDVDHISAAAVIRTLDMVVPDRVVVHEDNRIELPPNAVSRFAVAREDLAGMFDKGGVPKPLLEVRQVADHRYVIGVRTRTPETGLDLRPVTQEFLTRATIDLFDEAMASAPRALGAPNVPKGPHAEGPGVSSDRWIPSLG